jgi:menaquinol-cytochrome c reductase iron-sulfur subunit
MKGIAYGIGGVLTAGIAVPVLRVLGFPVGERVVVDPTGPVTLRPPGELVAGAPTVRLPVMVDGRRDAYRRLDNEALGSVWLSRTPEGKLRALQAECPHLGCAIEHDPAARQFRCPCHKSAFDESGARLSGPAKRGLDPLEVEEQGEVVRVRFQRFKHDVSEREPV